MFVMELVYSLENIRNFLDSYVTASLRQVRAQRLNKQVRKSDSNNDKTKQIERTQCRAEANVVAMEQVKYESL